ncbi:MAG: YtxH domain-containing protein [candidate division WOR-3 bacterium]
MGKGKTALLAFLAGVVVGGAMVVLLTPYTGEEIRDRLKREGRKLLNKIREDIKDIVERVEEDIVSIEEEE